jgi:hypothetical protein
MDVLKRNAFKALRGIKQSSPGSDPYADAEIMLERIYDYLSDCI